MDEYQVSRRDIEVTPEEFEKWPDIGEGWLSDYNLRLMKEIKNEGFKLELCLENYDYPKETSRCNHYNSSIGYERGYLLSLRLVLKIR